MFVLSLLSGAGLASHSAGAAPAVPSLALELRNSHFAEPLVRAAPTAPDEDTELTQALSAYRSRKDTQDFSALAGFLNRHPNSGWAPSLWTDLGVSYLHAGYFSRAMDAWHNAWEIGKAATDPRARATVDRAVSDLAQLYAGLGQFDKADSLFAEAGKRPISGSATEAWQNAAETLSQSKKDPVHLYDCGPIALHNLILAIDPKDRRGDFLVFYQASANGTNLAELGGLAQKASFSSRVIARAPGAPVPIPSVVHWKLGHYGAIVGMTNGYYHVEDTVVPGDGLWVTQAALDSESSGYFLIPASLPNRTGWRQVANGEASGIWGKGPTNNTNPGDHPDQCTGRGCFRPKPRPPGTPPGGSPPGPPPSGPPPGAPPGPPPSGCICSYGIMESVIGISLNDTPVGYTPPIGPAALVTISYNQREDSQPAVFNFSNVGPKWTMSWTIYVTDSPAVPGANVSRYAAGGGAFYYTGYNSTTGRFAAQADDGSVLVLTSTSPITYKRYLADGSVETYSQSDGSMSYPRNVFLTQVSDPQGNTLTVNYDSQDRITSLLDATGRSTTFSYQLSGFPLLITQITDPFGRSARLTYDSLGRLSTITDVISITSSFTYDANSLVDALTTPYGTTQFSYTAPGTSAPPRYVDVTDPLGYHEREEWLEPAPIPDSDPATTVPSGMPLAPTNMYFTYRDSFHWDKSEYIAAGCSVTGGCDYTKATDTHFLHQAGVSQTKSGVIESIKYPLENRIWYQYPGQTDSITTGNFGLPSAVGRVLDDGSTQITQNSYDTSGFLKLTQTIDPVGRTTTYTYANQIDLTGIAQSTTDGIHTAIAQYVYNTHHRPIFYTDAAGRTSSYGYNNAGELASVINALGQTTSYTYNSTGDLTTVTNANSMTAASYAYDAFNRILTQTDSEGWSETFSYDNANRVTSISYPDGTQDRYTYNKLDLASHTDRLGRITVYAYDADRRLVSVTDATGHQTLFGYNPDGQMISRTDPNTNQTLFAYDVEGRLTTKTYPDTSKLIYAFENTTSRLHAVTDALLQAKIYGYTKDSRISSISYTGAVNPTPNVSFSYDPYFSRVVSMSDGTGTTTYAYVAVGSDGALQEQSETTPYTSGTMSYVYDGLGRLSSRIVQGQGAETFTYDAIGRLTGHNSDLGSFTRAYLGQTTQLTSSSLANSTLATTVSYLPNSGDRRLSGVSTTGLSSGQYTNFAYTSNDATQVTGTIQTSDATVPYPPNNLLRP